MIIVEIYFIILQTIFRLKKTIHYNSTDTLDATMSLLWQWHINLIVKNENSLFNK